MRYSLFAAVLMALPFSVSAQEVVKHTSVNVLRPKKVEATEERVKSLRVAPGFRIAKFAEDLGNARMIAVAPDGAVFVTRREEGDLLRLRDTNGDGRGRREDDHAEDPALARHLPAR